MQQKTNPLAAIGLVAATVMITALLSAGGGGAGAQTDRLSFDITASIEVFAETGHVAAEPNRCLADAFLVVPDYGDDALYRVEVTDTTSFYSVIELRGDQFDQGPSGFLGHVYSVPGMRGHALSAISTGNGCADAHGYFDARFTIVSATASFTDEIYTGGCFGRTATMVARPGVVTVGTSGPDVIVGTEGPDTIRGNGGNDRICARGGRDNVHGGAGNDRIDLGRGHDVGRGNAGDDQIYGRNGKDTMSGNTGNDRMWGNGGRDAMSGGSGSDTLNGGGKADNISGNSGPDVLRGGAGPDTLRGGRGIDVCNGGPGRDTATSCETKTNI